MPTAAPGPERPDLYVVARFLDKLWHEEGAAPIRWTKARLQAAVRLNYDLFQKYVAILEERGLLVVEDGGRGERIVSLSPAGREAHRRLVGWLSQVFGPSTLTPSPRRGRRDP